ncbi:exodeoxyribonuclease VII large subunit [Thermodesulfobacteriota bacterium]
MQPSTTQRHILTVSELTSQIKSQLEAKFPFIWITGEISNFRAHATGLHIFQNNLVGTPGFIQTYASKSVDLHAVLKFKF